MKSTLIQKPGVENLSSREKIEGHPRSMVVKESHSPSHRSWLVVVDEWVVTTLNRAIERPGVLPFFAGVSSLGDGKLWYVFAAVLPFLYGTTGWLAVAHMAGAGVSMLLLYLLLKRVTQRLRPFERLSQVTRGVIPPDRYSFPSGHTMHAVGFTLVVAAWFPVFLPMLLAFTVLVATSRIILGLHYPTDVLLGGLIGFGVGKLSLILVF